MKYVYANGQPVPQGFCVLPSNFTQTFAVKVRSSRPLSESTIKRILQHELEVLDVDEDKLAGLCVVQNKPHESRQEQEPVPAKKGNIFQAALSYVMSNLDDLNEAMGTNFTEQQVADAKLVADLESV